MIFFSHFHTNRQGIKFDSIISPVFNIGKCLWKKIIQICGVCYIVEIYTNPCGLCSKNNFRMFLYVISFPCFVSEAYPQRRDKSKVFYFIRNYLEAIWIFFLVRMECIYAVIAGMFFIKFSMNPIADNIESLVIPLPVYPDGVSSIVLQILTLEIGIFKDCFFTCVKLNGIPAHPAHRRKIAEGVVLVHSAVRNVIF